MREKPNEEELSLVNLIAKEYLGKETSNKQLSFELINSLIYSYAVTLKQHLKISLSSLAMTKNLRTRNGWYSLLIKLTDLIEI